MHQTFSSLPPFGQWPNIYISGVKSEFILVFISAICFFIEIKNMDNSDTYYITDNIYVPDQIRIWTIRVCRGPDQIRILI